MTSILLIEDHDTLRAFYQKLLGECERCFDNPVAVETCEGLMDAATVASRTKPDCVLLDLTLRDSTQGQTIAAIASLRQQWDCPIVILTGAEDPQVRNACFRAGCDDFCKKAMANKYPSVLLEKCYNAWLRYGSRQRKT